MAAQRPGTVTAAAVMAMIYGCLFLICGLIAVVSLVAQDAMGQGFMGVNDPQQVKLQQEMQQIIVQKVPAYNAIQIVGNIFGLVAAIAMLIGGVALLSMSSWSRAFVMIWCFVIIATTIFQAIYLIAFVMPATNQAIDAALPAVIPQGGPQAPEMAKMTQALVTMMFVVGLIIYLVIVVYLAIIIGLLSGRRARLAFAGMPLDQEKDRGSDRSRDSHEGEENRDWDQPAPTEEPRIDPKDDWRIR
jgi:hypothetical protein